MLAAEGAVGKVLAVRIALLELDAEVGKDAFAEDVDTIMVGNEGDKSVELEGVSFPLTSRVIWLDLECAGMVFFGLVSKFSHDLRLSIDSNRNAMPSSISVTWHGVLGVAIKNSCIEEADEISAALESLLVTFESLVVIE